jgi:hypothetical protein
MDRYRIIPAHRAYKVVVMEPNGGTRLVKTWPTEEAAIAHLRLLRQRAELIDRQMAPTPPASGIGAADGKQEKAAPEPGRGSG